MIPWVVRMAMRDSRGSRRRLLLFMLSMSVGVAALVAINGFGANLRTAVDEQARALLGADLGVESDIPFHDSTEAVIALLDAEMSRRTTFASMAYFTRQEATRIVSVRAVSGGFPFYGDFVTEPADAVERYRAGQGALIDRTLAAQFELRVGDTLRIGTASYRVLGTLEKTSSEPAFVSLVSPRVYVPLEGLDESLLAFGSRVDYEVFFRLPDVAAASEMAERLDAELPDHVEIHTVDREREAWSEALGNLYRFLGLVALTALLLGSIGVASAIHVYIRQRRNTIAVLRCIGVTPGAASRIYLVQATALGLVGALVGAVAGTALQFLVPTVLAEALPFAIETRLYLQPIVTGVVAGVAITLLFALLPLLGVREVSPLAALRADVESPPARRLMRRPGYIATGVAAGVGVLAFGAVQAPSPLFGVGFVMTIAVVLLVLSVCARLASRAVRRYLPQKLPYVARQGLANLYRPNNQTQLILLAVGFGAFLVLTLLIVRSTLLTQVRMTDEGQRPNLIFFDVQPDQRPLVRDTVAELGLPIVEEAPIVSMRLQSVKGRVTREGREGEGEQSWAEDHEYRSTYRDFLTETEKLVEGQFVGQYGGSGSVPVSIEDEVAAELGVGIGDSLSFDVQGRTVEAVVASTREVDWNRMQTNFFVVFPRGVLEAAPQTYVLVTRAPDPEVSGRAQAAVVASFPNVSAIDLTLIIEVLEELFGRLSAVIQFMALFSIATGLLILAGAIAVSRFRRIDEVVLLKTLGASRANVRWVNAAEYVSLGGLSAFVALLLAVPVGWGLAEFVFDVELTLPAVQLAAAAVGVTILTAAIGVANSRGVYRAPAMAVLREAE